jgi:hypothetical protein
MANLVALPVEIQLEIYQNLTNIDDALHLARTCKRLNDVFETSSNRLNILRCIIVRLLSLLNKLHRPNVIYSKMPLITRTTCSYTRPKPAFLLSQTISITCKGRAMTNVRSIQVYR